MNTNNSNHLIIFKRLKYIHFKVCIWLYYGICRLSRAFTTSRLSGHSCYRLKFAKFTSILFIAAKIEIRFVSIYFLATNDDAQKYVTEVRISFTYRYQECFSMKLDKFQRSLIIAHITDPQVHQNYFNVNIKGRIPSSRVLHFNIAPGYIKAVLCEFSQSIIQLKFIGRVY